MALAFVSADTIGVTQDYMEDNVVKAPIGAEICHRIWASTDPSIAQGEVNITMSSDVPSFVTVSLSNNGIYRTVHGTSDAIIFHIRVPDSARVNDTWQVNFKVAGVGVPKEGMVPLVGSIGSSFTIRAMPSNYTVSDRCNPLPSDPSEVAKREAAAQAQQSQQSQAAQQQGQAAKPSAPSQVPDALLAVVVVVVACGILLVLLKLRRKPKEAAKKPKETAKKPKEKATKKEMSK